MPALMHSYIIYLDLQVMSYKGAHGGKEEPFVLLFIRNIYIESSISDHRADISFL